MYSFCLELFGSASADFSFLSVRFLFHFIFTSLSSDCIWEYVVIKEDRGCRRQLCIQTQEHANVWMSARVNSELMKLFLTFMYMR